MVRILVDTAVPLHAQGQPCELLDACVAVLRAIEEQPVEAVASVELIQEFVHVLRRRGGAISTIEAQTDRLRAFLRMIAFEPDDLDSMLELLSRYPQLGGRDAVHVVAAQKAGAAVIISPDSHFDGLAGIRRVDPRDTGAINQLTPAET